MRKYTLGYFIKKRHVSGAFKILTKQIETESPLYNTLDFTIYRHGNKINDFDLEKFYKNYIKEDVFYYSLSKFYILDYLGVQSAYKARNYNFLSFELLLIYNAIGLYIQEVLDLYQID